MGEKQRAGAGGMLPPLLRLRWPSLPLLRPPGSPRLLIMASIGFLLPSSGRLPRSPSFASTAAPSQPRCLRFYARAEGDGVQREPPLPSVSDNKSFAVATGELFLGLASLLLRRRGPGSPPASVPTGDQEVVASEEETDEGFLYFSDRGESIAAAVEDPVGQDVIWEQRLKDVEAEKKRKEVMSPGFSFSAAGLLFPYHLGVAQLLLEKGYITGDLNEQTYCYGQGFGFDHKGGKNGGFMQFIGEYGDGVIRLITQFETTPLAGSSAGAIICVVIASGSTMRDALKAAKILAEDCRIKGTAFRLGAVLRDVLKEFLPNDVHIRSNGRVRVAVTQLLWRPKGLLVDQFDSKEDLINAVFTSSFIPGYMAPRPATIFRNRLCIDGGLTLFMPPTSASETVRVCAFPASRLGLKGIGISPDCNPENRASPRQLFNWALEPAEDYVLDKLFELGYLDAAVWAEQNPVELIVRADYS